MTARLPAAKLAGNPRGLVHGSTGHPAGLLGAARDRSIVCVGYGLLRVAGEVEGAATPPSWGWGVLWCLRASGSLTGTFPERAAPYRLNPGKGAPG